MSCYKFLGKMRYGGYLLFFKGLITVIKDRIIVELTNPDTLPMVRKAVALKYADVNNDNAGFIYQSI